MWHVPPRTLHRPGVPAGLEPGTVPCRGLAGPLVIPPWYFAPLWSAAEQRGMTIEVHQSPAGPVIGFQRHDRVGAGLGRTVQGTVGAGRTPAPRAARGRVPRARAHRRRLPGHAPGRRHDQRVTTASTRPRPT